MKVSHWIYARRPEGTPGPEHYELETVELDPSSLFPDEILVEGRIWSVDPYMRIQQSARDTWESPHPLGQVQGGAVVGQVIASRCPHFAIGDWVETYLGWRTAGIRRADACRKLDVATAPPSTALHVLGMPGRTAYFGLLEAGRPRPGDTLLVSGAAGAVGSIVGQLGKLGGCRVIGVAGSAEKLRWLRDEIGFDAVLSYRELADMAAMAMALRELAPRGIDVYFDNTGGHVTDAVLETMSLRARIVICGQIGQYAGGLDTPPPGPRLLHHMLYKRATITGVLARDYVHRMDEMLAVMTPWVRDGKIKTRETRIKGFSQLPRALAGLFTGENFGKMLVEQ
jgi:NADPH-dependent curcumin reductase CurA